MTASERMNAFERRLATAMECGETYTYDPDQNELSYWVTKCAKAIVGHEPPQKLVDDAIKLSAELFDKLTPLSDKAPHTALGLTARWIEINAKHYCGGGAQ